MGLGPNFPIWAAAASQPAAPIPAQSGSGAGSTSQAPVLYVTLCSAVPATSRAVSALPASTSSRNPYRFGFSGVVTPVSDRTGLLPVRDSCPGADHAGRRAGSCWRGGGYRPVSRAFRCGVTGRGGRGAGRGQPALPWCAGRRHGPGDMMIDRVSPPCGDAAAQSNQAVRAGPARKRRTRLTGGLRELAAGVPHRVIVAALCPPGPGASRDWPSWWTRERVRRRRGRRRRARPGCGRPAGRSCGPRTGRRACRSCGP